MSDLKRNGFEQSLSDPCVLRFMMGDEVMGMVAIHVDGILYAGTKSRQTPRWLWKRQVTLFLRRISVRSSSFSVAHLFATARLARLTFLKKVTSGVFSRDLIFVAPARMEDEGGRRCAVPRGGGEPDVDRQPDKARHLECCSGGGEALSRA